MKKIYLAQSVGLLIIGCLTSFWIESCKTQSMAMSKPKSAVHMPITGVFILPVIVDTTQHPKPLTEAQKQAMVDKFSSNLVGKYVTPQMDRFYHALDHVSTAIDTQTKMFNSYRNRMTRQTDSLRSADNRHKSQLVLKTDSIFKLQLQLNSKEIYRDKRDSTRDAEQAISIATNKRLIDYIWLYDLLMGLGFVGLLIALRLLWARVNKAVSNFETLTGKKIITNE